MRRLETLGRTSAHLYVAFLSALQVPRWIATVPAATRCTPNAPTAKLMSIAPELMLRSRLLLSATPPLQIDDAPVRKLGEDVARCETEVALCRAAVARALKEVALRSSVAKVLELRGLQVAVDVQDVLTMLRLLIATAPQDRLRVMSQYVNVTPRQC